MAFLSGRLPPAKCRGTYNPPRQAVESSASEPCVGTDRKFRLGCARPRPRTGRCHDSLAGTPASASRCPGPLAGDPRGHPPGDPGASRNRTKLGLSPGGGEEAVVGFRDRVPVVSHDLADVIDPKG